MPKQYTEIRDSYIKRGKSAKEAKRLAAMTYNSKHPGHPMHPHKKKKFHVPQPNRRGFYD